jgi:hypothetical protein
MAEKAKRALGAGDAGNKQFPAVHRAEIDGIKKRRKKLGRGGDPLDPKKDATVYETVGLALSGGGVRSAAFALGALQALDHHNVLRKIDYLSTVSGGGYMGSSLSATMSVSEGEFVFRGKDADSRETPGVSEIADTEAVGHIRNYANYLIPRGLRDVLTGIAIVVRGLVANIALVLPVILLLAAVTIWSNPTRTALKRPDLFGWPLEKYLPLENFGVTLVVALAAFALFLLWALYRSTLAADKLAEFRTRLPTYGAALLVTIAFSFFCELQPFLVAGMFDLADDAGAWGHVTGAIKGLAAITAPIAAAVAFFRQQLGALVSTDDTSSFSLKALVPVGKLAVWLAGLALPLLIWVAYLYLCYWGIINDQAGATGGDHTPRWLLTISEYVSSISLLLGYGVIQRPMAILYLVVALVLLALSWCLKPNANSLHRLYRDRLSKTFLFDPRRQPEGLMAREEVSIDQRRDFAQLDTMRLSKLSAEYAPYHLINAALNVQGSDYANRRGRNADFFLLSPLYVGSFATGYERTVAVEKAAPDLDLATAMAISGAAASSNMGAKSIRPLTATLAILNIRLGYWLKNPRYADEDTDARKQAGPSAPRKVPRNSSWLFLWSEITGRLYENSNEVYLTDGGHIENLGIYELLRRRCRVIVCIDAEADPDMQFSSFVTLQRYARIDLGVRIDMPWDVVRSTTRTTMKPKKNAEPSKPAHGPHAAVGVIDYGEGEKGYLLYIKSSLSGDENDYIRDYARRHPQFPHETTGDQFFSEEQFEVYRALAFHAVHRTLDGSDGVEAQGSDKLESFKRPANDAVKAVRAALN